MAKRDDIAEELRRLSVAIAPVIRDLAPAIGKEMEGVIKQRIFVNGQNADGGQIGQYSTRGFLLDVNETKGVLGSQVNTSRLKPNAEGFMYIAGGYAEFRKLVGRQNQKVDLSLTGDLERSISTGTTEDRVTIAFTREDATELAAKLEDKYGEVFAAQDVENENVLQFADDLIFERLDKIIGIT